MKILPGLHSIAGAYDAFIVDLWGVVHDGVAPYPAALDCLARLAGRPVLLLSNAPRRAASVRRTLQRLGVPDTLYTHILTSGEASWQALTARSDPWFARLGPRVFHLGPARDRGVMEETPLIPVDRPEDADFVLNTGPDDERDRCGIEAFVPVLEACHAAHLPMLCANPDLEIVRGGERILCAGALAAWYRAQGGDVREIGKPDPAIYDTALQMIGTARDRVLAIGDSLRTDIAGARNAGIDAAWVTGGIHEEALRGRDPAEAAREAGLAPAAILPALAW